MELNKVDNETIKNLFHVELNTQTQIKVCPICGNSKLSIFLEGRDFFLSNEQFDILRCDKCSQLVTNPQPIQDEIGKYYKSESYFSHTDEGKSITARIYKALRYINLRSKYKIVAKYIDKGKILDIGCGIGALLNHFKGKGWETFGIEPDAEARKYAIEKFKLEVRGEDAIQTLPKNSLDVVSMWHVLEHVYNPVSRMEEVYKLLQPEGIAVIALPNPESYDAIIYKKYWGGWDLPRHLNHFTKKSFQYLALKVGFEILAIKPMKLDAFYVSLLSEEYIHGKKRFGAAFMKGVISNCKGRTSGNYSSTIFILKKQ